MGWPNQRMRMERKIMATTTRFSAGGRARDHKLQSMQSHEVDRAAKKNNVPRSRVLEAMEALRAGNPKKALTHKAVDAWLKEHYGAAKKAVDAVSGAVAVLTGSKDTAKYKPGDKVKMGKGKKVYEVAEGKHTPTGFEYRLKGVKNAVMQEQLNPG